MAMASFNTSEQTTMSALCKSMHRLSHSVIVSVSGYWQRQRNVPCLILSLCLSRCLILSMCLSRCLILSLCLSRCLILSLCVSLSHPVIVSVSLSHPFIVSVSLSHPFIVSVSGHWQQTETNALCKTVHWLSHSVNVSVSGYWQNKGTNALCKSVHWLSHSVTTATVIVFGVIAVDRLVLLQCVHLTQETFILR